MNLLSEEALETGIVQKTALTKKLTLDGETRAYPVYRVRLDQLFYNEQNDRIATWINQYKSENGEDAFSPLNMESYNKLIEGFIVESNPAAIEKTQKNIELVAQREPGVTLPDGRIIDGNRRFTCLRRLALTDPEYNWFETVILDKSLKSSRKQIKMLELAIQHGEEKKVDYNPIDRLVGVYHDIIKSKLLSVEEYAYSTNETVLEVKKRIEHAAILAEFMEYINLPEQFYIAREYQVVLIITEMTPLLKQFRRDNERIILKEAIFNNILMKCIKDNRKFVRSINDMIKRGTYSIFIRHQSKIGSEIKLRLEKASPSNLEELNDFVWQNIELAEDLKNSFENYDKSTKKREIKSRPSLTVSKSISMLRDVDTRIFETLNEDEKSNLIDRVNQLSDKVIEIRSELCDESNTSDTFKRTQEQLQSEITPKIVRTTAVSNVEDMSQKNVPIEFKIASRHIDEPMIYCRSINKPITTLIFNIEFYMEEALSFQKGTAEYVAFFVNEKNETISNTKEIVMQAGQSAKFDFTLVSGASVEKLCYLAIRSAKDTEDSLQQKIPFILSLSFPIDFGF